MAVDPAIHPFPGLRPFEAEEHELFFGREGQSEEILGRLHRNRFVAVVGASGSGKSSLIRAGLLPYLHGGFLGEAGSHWRIAIFRPGGDPIKNLASALNDPAVLGKQEGDAAENTILLEVSLRRSGLGLTEAVRLARLPADEQVLIVVDQFEELFRFANAAGRPGQDEDAAAFVKLLLEASRQRELPIYVVITMRSDYIGDCARYRDLPEAVTDGLYLIPRMTREQRRAAIVEPVRVGGGAIAPRLVVRLLNDVGDDPDQLPILQHALMRTWDYWKAHGGSGRAIDVDDYLAIGGMADALSQHADEAYDGLPDDRYRGIAKRIFQALSEKGLDNRETRRPTPVNELAQVAIVPIADVIRVVDDFRAPGRSFLMPPQAVALEAASIVDISHESLIRGWRRMRQWVEEEAESARVYRRLADTASLHAQGAAGILRDPDLEHVLAWRDRERPNAEWGRRYHSGFEQAMAFLEQSRIAREAERQQRRSARRRMQLISSAVTAVIAIVAIVALWQSHKANLERENAQQALNTAEAQRKLAEQALSRAESEHDRMQKAARKTTEIANTLVFDLAQDARIKALAADLLNTLLAKAIEGYTEVIELNPNSDAYNGRGAAYAAERNYDRAIADYDKAIQFDPKSAAAYSNRGNAYRNKGDYDHAIPDYTQAIALDAKNAIAYNGRGNAYNDKGDHDSAIADYSQAIQLDPKFEFAYNGRGNAYSDKGDYDRAIADYSQAIQLDPKDAIAYNNRGNAFNHKGDYDRGIADYDVAIQLDPKYAVAYSNRCNAYENKGDYDHAIADCDVAIRLNPKYTRAYDNRGDAYKAKGDLDHAIADYSQAIQLDPKYAVAYNDRGHAYYAKKDYGRAIADYGEAIKLNANNASYYNDRGVVYDEKGDYDAAIADYNEAIRLNPKYAFAYNNRGNAYYDKDDYDRAIADYDEAIQLDPKYAVAYSNRGNAYKGKRDYDHAIADYTEAVRFDPKYARAYDNRGDAFKAKNDYDRAIADYSEAIKLDAKNAVYYDDRGIAYDEKGDYASAIADYNEAIRLNPKYVAAYNNRGNAYRDSDQFERAIADYDEALRLDPKDALAYSNRGKAYRLDGNLERAIADYGEAIRLDPKSTAALNNRGNAYRDKGELDRAIADYTEAIRLNPKSDSGYFNRGLANVYAGALSKALADFNEANKLDPTYAYTALWLDIVDKRSNLPSMLAQASEKIDMTKWPAPIVRLFLGQLTPEAVLAAVNDPNPATKKDQVCEANFYTGELDLQGGRKENAARLFRLAAANCPKNFIEWGAASVELKALGATR